MSESRSKQSVQSLNGITKKFLQKFSVFIGKIASRPAVQNITIPAFINIDTYNCVLFSRLVFSSPATTWRFSGTSVPGL